MNKLLALTLALITATSSSIAAAAPALNVQLHGSALTRRQRIEQRIANRIRTADVVKAPSAHTTETRLTPRSRRQRRLRRTEVHTGVRTRSLRLRQTRMERRARRLAGTPGATKIEVIAAVNLERAKQGKAPLRWNGILESAAQRHADDMQRRDFFSHKNPEGLMSGDRIQKAGYGFVDPQTCRCSYEVYLGENIARGQTSVTQVVSEWMASQSHREAILSEDFKEVGVGIVADIWVLNFGGVFITPGRAQSMRR